MRLTPLAERFPYIDYLPFMKDLLVWGVGISSWTIGDNLTPLTLVNDSLKSGGVNDSIRLGKIICIESIHPHHIRDLVLQGTNMLIVITNDSWYDYTAGPRQHYIIAAARAIESRRYIARCANSGVSGVISPTGKSIAEATQYQKTAIAVSVPLVDINELTLYTKIGDVCPYICFIVVIIVVAVFRNKLRIKK
jgi:apolipoprotein N-acyltransferase